MSHMGIGAGMIGQWEENERNGFDSPELADAVREMKAEEKHKELNRPGGSLENHIGRPTVANKVRGQVVGGAEQTFDGVTTVADVAAKLGASDRTAMVNGQVADMSTVLSDYAYVSFSDKKRGGKR